MFSHNLVLRRENAVVLAGPIWQKKTFANRGVSRGEKVLLLEGGENTKYREVINYFGENMECFQICQII